MLQRFQSRRQVFKKLNRQILRGSLYACEALERRVLLSTINWTNKGSAGNDSDNFNLVFGSRAANARADVVAAFASWSRVITDFHNGNNTINISVQMGTTSNSSYGAQARLTGITAGGTPTAGTFTISPGTDDNGDGIPDAALWYVDPTPTDNAEFAGGIVNAFAGTAQAGSPASGLYDLYTVVLLETSHIMGFTSVPSAKIWTGGLLTQTGITIPAGQQESSVGLPGYVADNTYWRFQGSDVTALLNGNAQATINANAANYAATGTGASPYNAVHVTGGNGSPQLVAAGVTTANLDSDNALFSPSTRYTVSRLDALILKDAYGYTITEPQTFGTFYAMQDVNGRLLIRGGAVNSNDVINLSVAGSNLNVSVAIGNDVQGTAALPAWVSQVPLSSISSIVIQSGDGDDTVHFGGGSLTSMPDATINLGDGNDTLIIDDSANNAVTSYEVLGTQIDRTNYLLGVAQFDSSVENVKFLPGSGFNDVVNVYGTRAATTIQSANGSIINIGDSGSVQGINGVLTISNPSTHSSLNIDDSSDAVARTFVVLSASGATGSLTGLAPAPISWATNDINGITVNGGTGGNDFYFTTAGIAYTTTLNTGGGNDLVQFGNAIAGSFAVNGQGGTDTVNVDESTTAAQSYLLTSTGLSRTGFSVSYANIESLILNDGSGADTVDVESLPTASVSINNGGGSDIFQAMTTGKILYVPYYGLSFNGGGFSTLTLDNSASSNVNATTITSTSISPFSPYPINYSGISTLTYNLAAFSNIVNMISTTPTTAYVINGGAGSDLLDLGQGNLTNVVSATIFNGGGITFNPGGGADKLLLDDSASNTPLSYQINPGTLDIVNHLHVAFGNGLALVLNAGTGPDTETVSGTGFGVPLTINESSGNATGLITGSNTNSPIAINAGSGTDNFTVGATGGTLGGFNALVTVTGQTGSASLTVNDRVDQNFTVSNNKVGEKFGNGVAHEVDYVHLINLTANVGAGGSGNTMTVSSTAPGTALFVNEAAGNNSVIIGNAANTQAILGDVTIGNVLGQTALLVDDSADTTGRNVTLTKSAITGLAPAIIHYIENGSATTGIRPLTLKTGSGNDTFIVDFSNGNPLAASAASFDGGPGVNTLAVIGTTASDTLAANSTSFTFTGGIFGTVPITATHIQSLQFHGGSGGNDSINLTGGVYTIDADTLTGTPNVSVTVGPTAIANFTTDQHLANLTLNGGVANLSNTRHSMHVNGLAISNNGLLDIANSFLYLNNTATSFATVKSYLDAAYNLHGLGNTNAPYAGDYKGVTGITSSVAKTSYATDEVVGIGYYDGALQDPNNPDSAGQIVGPNSDSGHGTGIPLTKILIRPTLTGDFNGDGVVNSYDVSLFNSYGLFNNGPTPLGWQAGDLNGDGVVNVKDVTVFNSVGNFNAPPFPVPAVKTAVAKVLAQPVAVKGTSTAVATVPPKSHHVRHHSVRKAGPGKVAERIARVIGALRRV